MASPRASQGGRFGKSKVFGQTVVVLQGGGALGAYQVGVYRALHEAGIEPDWVVGTSIGAINGALIVGNRPEQRLARLNAFWDALGQSDLPPWFNPLLGNTEVLARGIPGFFAPNPLSFLGPDWPVGIERAAYYDTQPLRQTLSALVDFDWLRQQPMRLTVGAVNVRSGALEYFDSKRESLTLEHIMASGALPPAFPAVQVNGEYYWDGGIYSNTPLEAVLDDNPRRDSLIFAVNMWHRRGAEPASIWQALGRQKDIQYASRADSHILRQCQLHRLRHIIRELGQRLPAEMQQEPEIKEMMGYGCLTKMHVVRLQAPRLPNEDATKDIDFSAAGIGLRRQAGYRDTLAAIDRAEWNEDMPPLEGMRIQGGE
ncbi:MAG TPA: patatin-like phospholipase family protein [Azospira sp.]|nr:patatin-like phospholipase family protein [Azospira sp.]